MSGTESFRELLELSAKAAGYELHWGFTDPMIRCHEPEQPDKTHNLWNPLTDDGDAQRLAVKLGLFLHVSVHAECSYVTDGKLPPKVSVKEMHGDDPYAATRRAIVRAAAEIGRAMP